MSAKANVTSGEKQNQVCIFIPIKIDTMKKLLILGGGNLMGRLLVEKLIEKGIYDLTLFNRGRTNAHLFPEVERIIGDRNTDDMTQIFEEFDYWDVIIDFSSYQPDPLERLIKGLEGKVGRYIYISTVSVYPYESEGVKTEKIAISPCTPEQRIAEAINGETYGPKKAECERILQAANWLDALIFRPSNVYGQYDYTQRLYYWLYRAKTQTEFFIPDDGTELSNFTFVDDMVAILLEAIEIKNHRKVYNTTTHEPNAFLEKMGAMTDLLDTNPTLIPLAKEKWKANEDSLKGGFPCYRGSNKLSYDHSKLLTDFSVTLTPFRESIKRMIAYHDAHNLWEEGATGIRVADEQAFIKRLNSGKLS